MEGMRELKYILAYVSKVGGYTKPYEFVYDETEQFVFESILFSHLIYIMREPLVKLE